MVSSRPNRQRPIPAALGPAPSRYHDSVLGFPRRRLFMNTWRIGRYAIGMLLTAFVGVSAAQDAKTVLADASKALGADTLNTVEFSATGFDYVLGQAYNPSSPWPKFINKSYTRVIDFRTPASKVDRIRMQGENP